MNLCEHLSQQVDVRPDAPAIEEVEDGDVITYRDLQNRIDRVAAWLDKRGIGEDDRVAIYMPYVFTRRTQQPA